MAVQENTTVMGQQGPARTTRRHATVSLAADGADHGAAHDAERLAKLLGWFSVGLGMAEIVAPGRVADLIGARKNGNLVRSLGAREVANGLAILNQPRTAAWVWARVGGDLVDLALLAAALKSRRSRRKRLIAAAAAVGGVTALDVLCSHRLSQPAIPIQITRSITIGRAAQELYERWQTSLPQIMEHFAEVHLAGGGRAHWVICLPVGGTIEWDSEVVERRPGEFLGWKSVAGATLGSEGSVSFSAAPRDLGTEVTLHLSLRPPGGGLGEKIVKVLRLVPAMVAEKALRRFKSLVEAGEVPSLERNPSARGDAKGLVGRLTS